MIHFSSGANSFLNCVSKCSVHNCGEVADKFFFRGEEGFEELFDLSGYPKEYKEDIQILSFCSKHAVIRRIDEE